MRKFSYKTCMSVDFKMRYRWVSKSQINLVWLQQWWRFGAHNININHEFLKTATPLKKLYGIWEGLPCLVLGGGPSLYDEIENVKTLIANGAKVIAVDVIFNYLKENGIKPDLTISADMQGICANFFDSKNIEPDDCFALNVMSHPFVYDVLKGAKIYPYATFNPNDKLSTSFSKRLIESRFGTKFYSTHPHGVVGMTALEIAMWMGAKQIITVGNDLCWRTKQDALRHIPDENIQEVQISKTGEIVWTTRGFGNASYSPRFLAWFFPDGKMVPYDDAPLWVDCSFGLIDAFHQVKMSDLITLLEKDVPENETIISISCNEPYPAPECVKEFASAVC